MFRIHTREDDAQILSHGLGGVQDRHYNRHDYMDKKSAALDAWCARLAEIVEGARRQNKVTMRRNS